MHPMIVDVAILGAGMAGLRAAQVIQGGRPDGSVVVIEARNVAGGRIRWTHLDAGEDKPLYIDQGAQYIHGLAPRKHPIHQLADRTSVPYQRVDWDDGYVFVGPNGKELSSKLERKQEATVAKIMKQVGQWQKGQRKILRQGDPDDHRPSDMSLQSVVEPWVQQACQNDPTLSATRLWTALRMEISDDYGADLHQLSARHYDQDTTLGHGDAVPCTYQALVQAMLPADDNEMIRYQHVVEHVTFPANPTDLVCITCRRTDNDEPVEIQARRVICTLPLGVLKQQQALFEPALPARLQTAVDHLGFGCLEKVWLQFDVDKPFWPTDADVFYHMADNADTPFRLWFLPARVYKNAAYARMLCCFVSGDAARALAAQSHTETAAQALDALRQILTVPAGTDLIANVHVTQWATDPWSGGGSYSHNAVHSTPNDYRVWQASQSGFYDNRLWFAGEATSPLYPGTVHGAYLTGEWAAKACVQSLGK